MREREVEHVDDASAVRFAGVAFEQATYRHRVVDPELDVHAREPWRGEADKGNDRAYELELPYVGLSLLDRVQQLNDAGRDRRRRVSAAQPRVYNNEADVSAWGMPARALRSFCVDEHDHAVGS